MYISQPTRKFTLLWGINSYSLVVRLSDIQDLWIAMACCLLDEKKHLHGSTHVSPPMSSLHQTSRYHSYHCIDWSDPAPSSGGEGFHPSLPHYQQRQPSKYSLFCRTLTVSNWIWISVANSPELSCRLPQHRRCNNQNQNPSLIANACPC